MNPEPLSTLAIGQKARIANINLPPEPKQRLMEMGLTPGTECQIVRYAPLGDPLDLKVRGYHISIRKSEAEGILVQK